MTDSRFAYLLKTAPGIGVRATTAAGNELLYFYEDFDGPGTGMDRAMSQLYPQLNKGLYTGLVFVSGESNRN